MAIRPLWTVFCGRLPLLAGFNDDWCRPRDLIDEDVEREVIGLLTAYDTAPPADTRLPGDPAVHRRHAQVHRPDVDHGRIGRGERGIQRA
jgi:hypothetical protein